MPHLRFAMVCASNQNRSMEAHALLHKSGLEVRAQWGQAVGTWGGEERAVSGAINSD